MRQVFGYHFARGIILSALASPLLAADTDAIRLDPTSAVSLNDRGEVFRKKGDFENAIKDYTEAIRLNPNFAWPYNNRGLAWAAKGESEKAIKDYAEAIRLDPKYSFPFNNRGLMWVAKGQFENAITDYTEAIRLDPRYTFALNNRGLVWEAKGDFSKAIEDYAEAIQLDSKYAAPHNAIAWLRATCHDQRFRGGKEAVLYATKACELTDWKAYPELDTLAAAYAEAGEFTSAVIWAVTALEKAPAAEKQDAAERLELYRANQPYHQTPKP